MNPTLRLMLMCAICLLQSSSSQAQTNEDLTLVADFAIRDTLPQSPVPVAEWGSMNGWGPKSAAYPAVTVPAGHEPVAWKRARVLAVAKKYIGLPYRHHHIPGWAPAGETDPLKAGKGLDCSNFTAWVYNYGLGIKFTSDIAKQSEGKEAPGRVLAAGESLAAGDLLFILKGDRSCVSHVVIYIDAEHIIDSHADGVAIRSFTGWYRTHLSHTRRLLE